MISYTEINIFRRIRQKSNITESRDPDEQGEKTQETYVLLLYRRAHGNTAFNSLAMPMITENKIKEVDYGKLISMTESGKVKKAEYRSSRTRSCSLVKKMTGYTRPWWTTNAAKNSTMQAFDFR
ncbi:MAG: hypothetical protein V8Q65_00075 [Bacteroidaceae bacterium]